MGHSVLTLGIIRLGRFHEYGNGNMAPAIGKG
jgi:hypothetical protein